VEATDHTTCSSFPIIQKAPLQAVLTPSPSVCFLLSNMTTLLILNTDFVTLGGFKM